MELAVGRGSQVLGAVCGGVDLADIDAVAFTAIEDALLAHQVVFFRDEDLSPAAQLSFARRLGKALLYPAYPVWDDAVSVLAMLKFVGRCTQHRPINDYSGHRKLHRVTIAGGVSC